MKRKHATFSTIVAVTVWDYSWNECWQRQYLEWKIKRRFLEKCFWARWLCMKGTLLFWSRSRRQVFKKRLYKGEWSVSSVVKDHFNFPLSHWQTIEQHYPSHSTISLIITDICSTSVDFVIVWVISHSSLTFISQRRQCDEENFNKWLWANLVSIYLMLQMEWMDNIYMFFHLNLILWFPYTGQ